MVLLISFSSIFFFLFFLVFFLPKVILGVVCACLRGAYGPEFFATPRAELRGWPLGEMLVACSLFGVVITLIKQL